MDNDSTNQFDSQWPAVLESLEGSMPAGSFNTHFLGSVATIDGGRLIVSVPASANLEMIENRLSGIVRQKVKSVHGVDFTLVFVKAEAKAIHLPDAESDDDSEREFVGAYHNAENAIIQPDRKEWAATRYFREKWRPLLGPLLSELVRELRQLCHHKSQRNTTKTTYKTLADALGVSEPTIKRALKRNKDGSFQNELLGHFIADMRIIKYSSGRDKIRNEGTQFIVYLDEPLTPDDQAGLSKVSK